MAEEDRMPVKGGEDGIFEGRATYIDRCDCDMQPCRYDAVYYRDNGKHCWEQQAIMEDELLLSWGASTDWRKLNMDLNLLSRDLLEEDEEHNDLQDS